MMTEKEMQSMIDKMSQEEMTMMMGMIQDKIGVSEDNTMTGPQDEGAMDTSALPQKGMAMDMLKNRGR